MYESYFFRNIKKILRNMLIISFLVFTAAMIYLASEFTLFFNLLAGPLKVQVSEVNTINTGKVFSRNFVSVQGENIIPLNIEYVENLYDKYTHKIKKTTVKGDYFAVVSGNRMIIALSPRGKQITFNAFTGVLERINSDNSAFYKHQIQKDSPGDADLELMPYMVNGLIYDDMNVLVTVVMIIALLISIIIMIRCVILWIKPEKHKTYKRLRLYGEPTDIIQKIEDEYRVVQNQSRVGKLMILNKWIAIEGLFSFRIIRSEDLLWVYKKVIRRRLNGIVPIGKEYELILDLSSGKTETERMSEKNVDKAIAKLLESFPWAVYGYSEEIRDLRERRFHEFLQFVESRKNSSNSGATV